MAHATSGLDLANRRSLIESLPHFKVAAEIGVGPGEFSEVIRTSGKLDDETNQKLRDALDDFAGVFQPTTRSEDEAA